MDKFIEELDGGITKVNSEIPPLGYRPKAPYQLDLEIFTVADLKARGSTKKVQTTHRYEFYALVCVTQGVCTQVVDFKPISCAAGSLLVLRPGQAHNYGKDEGWDGWNVLFRPEFVLPASTVPRDLGLAANLHKLPEHIALSGSELLTVMTTIQQMREDASLDAQIDDVHALLRSQLHGLLTRLSIVQSWQRMSEPATSPAWQRFKRFQQLVEARFAESHRVNYYASQLGYTEKSLARAVESATGVTAKAFIAARINLEAKRLLVHTDVTIATIAQRLGFDEATNFSKFFRRESGCAPAEFRQRQRAAL